MSKSTRYRLIALCILVGGIFTLFMKYIVESESALLTGVVSALGTMLVVEWLIKYAQSDSSNSG